MILEPFYPKEWVDSTYEIDWEGWREKGKKGVIFDIDNTLVPHGARQTSGRWPSLNSFMVWDFRRSFSQTTRSRG